MRYPSLDVSGSHWIVALATPLVAFGACAASAADWPGWRGPNRDGHVAAIQLPSRWPKELKTAWKIPVGEGHACPVVLGDKVYQFSREGEDEVLRCVDLSSGRQLWRTGSSVQYEMNQYAKPHGKGPKSTPAAANGRIYTLGISGHLLAHDAATGAVKWRKSFAREFPATSPLYGTASSPLADGDLCIAHVGGHDRGALRAFDGSTGEVRWSFGDDGPSYASPILVNACGERQVVTQTQKRIVGVSATEGKLLWELPFKTEYDQNIVTIAAWKDLLVYSGLDSGTHAIRIEKMGSGLAPAEVWKTDEVSMYMSSPVVAKDRLFAASHKQKGQLFCLDPGTGKTLWKGPGGAGDNICILAVGDALAWLTDRAELVFTRADAAAFEPVARYKVSDSPTWAHPVFVEGGVLIKDKTTLALLKF